MSHFFSTLPLTLAERDMDIRGKSDRRPHLPLKPKNPAATPQQTKHFSNLHIGPTIPPKDEKPPGAS